VRALKAECLENVQALWSAKKLITTEQQVLRARSRSCEVN